MSKTLLAFDLYGTLLSTSSVAEALAAHFGEEKAKSIATVWRKYQLEYTWRLNSMRKYEDFNHVTRQSLHHALAEHSLSLSDSDTEVLMTAYDNLSTFPEVSSALQALSSNPNITSVVFSNGTKSMVTASVHKSNDLSPHASVFADIVTVDLIRTYKPAPEVYKYLAQRTDMVGREADMWLISGNPFDVTGARSVGMQAAWVDREGKGWCDRLGIDGEDWRPTVIVKGLDEVVQEVEKWVAAKK